jgi:SAM-dependent methyltransferase
MPIHDSPLRCPRCKGTLARSRGSHAQCGECASRYPEYDGILDLLGEPSDDVQTEWRGLAAENHIELNNGEFDAVKFLVTDAIDTTRELMERSRSGPIQYYQQGAAAYFEALSHCPIDAGLRVLEIGGGRTYWKLRIIRDLCDEAYSLNIFFHVSRNDPAPTWPERILADMNDLPFEDKYFDLVICSATLHHSSDLGRVFGEISRVLRPDGRVIVVNEPVQGVAKALGSRARHTRDEHIHEDPVSFVQWRRAIRDADLVADHFVPAWFLGQLRSPRQLPVGTRFRGLAFLVAPLAKPGVMSELCRTLGRVPGQFVLGLPLNAVLWKRKATGGLVSLSQPVEAAKREGAEV